MTSRHKSFPALSPHGFTKVAYIEWGPEKARDVLVCVHGLTRAALDFERLATSFAAHGTRVVAIDMPGRGQSEWLKAPEDYSYPHYLNVAAALIARLEVEAVDWLGTSMGGLIGMMLAAQPGTPIRRLIVNDVGPFLPKAAIERIAQYVGKDPRFADFPAAESYLKTVMAPFGRLSEAAWRHLTTHSVVEDGAGKLRLHYDPAIGLPFSSQPAEDISVWPVWEGIACPTLILRGVESDLLLKETAVEMTKRGIAAERRMVELREIEGCGHAPPLLDSEQIEVVRDWLARSY